MLAPCSPGTPQISQQRRYGTPTYIITIQQQTRTRVVWVRTDKRQMMMAEAQQELASVYEREGESILHKAVVSPELPESFNTTTCIHF